MRHVFRSWPMIAAAVAMVAAGLGCRQKRGRQAPAAAESQTPAPTVTPELAETPAPGPDPAWEGLRIAPPSAPIVPRAIDDSGLPSPTPRPGRGTPIPPNV